MNQDRRNSLWLAVQYSVTIIFSLITLKLNLVNYGQELFGSWILVSSLWGLGRVVDFGLGTSVLKFAAEFHHKAFSDLKYLISTCFYLMIVLGIFIFIVILVLGELLYFGNKNLFSADHYEQLRDIFIVLGVSFYLSYISIIIKSFFEGMGNFVTPSKINIIYVSSILVSVVICFIFNLQILILAYSFLICSLLNLIFTFILFRIYYPDIRISWKFVRFDFAKKVFSFSLAIQGSTILGSLIDPLIKYLIGNFSSVGLVSIYEIARRFVTAIAGLFNTTFRPILPKASILTTKEDYKDFVYSECAKLSKLGITYSGTVFGMGALFIPIIIQQVFNYDEAILMYFILAIPESINNFGYSIYNFIIGIEKAYFLALVQLINLTIIGLSVSAGLIIFGNTLGLLGYGLTVVLVNILMLIFVREAAGISIRQYFTISKIYKLIILLLLLLGSIFILYYNFSYLYGLIVVLGIISVAIFISDLKNYSKVILNKIDFRRDV